VTSHHVFPVAIASHQLCIHTTRFTLLPSATCILGRQPEQMTNGKSIGMSVVIGTGWWGSGPWRAGLVRTHTLGSQPDQVGDSTKPRPWGSLHAVVPLSSTPHVAPYTVRV